MALYHLNIGSNLGNRKANIAKAIAEITLLSTTKPIISKPVETEPWGFSSSHNFINMGINITCSLQPLQLLLKIKEIEHSICPDSHRKPDGSYAVRLIDIDIILADNLSINISETNHGLPALIIPHPKMHQRKFVLKPLAELLPSWMHPTLHLTPSQMLANLE